jgi:hypothetical protein
MQYARGTYLSDAESQDARIFKKVAERSSSCSGHFTSLIGYCLGKLSTPQARAKSGARAPFALIKPMDSLRRALIKQLTQARALVY